MWTSRVSCPGCLCLPGGQVLLSTRLLGRSRCAVTEDWLCTRPRLSFSCKNTICFCKPAAGFDPSPAVLPLPCAGGRLGSCSFLILYPRPERALGCSKSDPLLPAGLSWFKKRNRLSPQACPHLTLQEEIFSRAPGIAGHF